MENKPLHLDKHAIPLEPSFFILVVAAGGVGNTNLEMYQSRVVAYTRKEAIDAVLQQLATEEPELYKRGNVLGGWRTTHSEQITGDKLEEMFKERANRERETEKSRVKMERNKLLKQIVDTGDVTLLHQAIRDGKLTDYERIYIHQKLTEGKGIEEAPPLVPRHIC